MTTGWRSDYSKYRDYYFNIIKLYKNKPNLKIYLELILSLFTITVFSVFALRPTLITIINLNKEIVGKEETVSKLKQKIQNLQTVSSTLQKIEDKLPLITQAIPISASPEVFIKQIENLANQTGVKIFSFSTSDILLIGNKEDIQIPTDLTRLPENADELPFSLSVTGSYTNISIFLKSIENFRRPIKFDSFAITSSVSEETGKTLTLTINGRLPFLYEQKGKSDILEEEVVN